MKSMATSDRADASKQQRDLGYGGEITQSSLKITIAEVGPLRSA